MFHNMQETHICRIKIEKAWVGSVHNEISTQSSDEVSITERPLCQSRKMGHHGRGRYVESILVLCVYAAPRPPSPDEQRKFR